MGKIIVALCSFAAGLGLGLLVGSMQSESMRQVVAERDRFAVERGEYEKTTRAELASLRGKLADRQQDNTQRRRWPAGGDVWRAIHPPGRTAVRQPPAQDSQIPARSWTIKQASKSTETFYVGSRTWHIAWEVLGKLFDDTDPTILCTVYEADGADVATFYGSQSGSSVVRAGPGEFYLDFVVAGGEVKFTVVSYP